MVKIWDWFRNYILKAIIVAALSASAVAYFKGIFDDIIGNVLSGNLLFWAGMGR